MIAPAHTNDHPAIAMRSTSASSDTNGLDGLSATASHGSISHTTVHRVIGKHPIIAVTIAGLIGVTIGCLVKRRDH